MVPLSHLRQESKSANSFQATEMRRHARWWTLSQSSLGLRVHESVGSIVGVSVASSTGLTVEDSVTGDGDDEVWLGVRVQVTVGSIVGDSVVSSTGSAVGDSTTGDGDADEGMFVGADCQSFTGTQGP